MGGTRDNWKDRCVYAAVSLFGWCCRRLSKRAAMRLGRGIGVLCYHLIKKRRAIALKNLEIAFRDTFTPAERAELCKDSFVNVGKTCVEFLRFPALTPENIWENVSVEGAENLEAALAAGRGAVVFLPHFGNWELLSLVYGALIPDRAKAIAFPLKNERLNRYIWERREQMRLTLIPRKAAVRETLRALKRNEAVGFFGDQNAGAAGVFVDFFGRPAAAARGPAVFALRTGAPLLFSLSVRQSDDRHRVSISEPIYTERSDDFEADVLRYTALLQEPLACYVRAYPAQWLWLHDRWKTRPRCEDET